MPGNFNLVPNPSFEFNGNNYDNQPYDTDFVNNRICWISANGFGNPIRHYLNDHIHYQYIPHTGNYAAWGISIIGYGYDMVAHIWDDSISQFRVYQQTKLNAPLVAGTVYYFTMYIGANKITTLSPHGDIIANIGVYFSNTKLSDYANTGRINVLPQIRFTNWDVPGFDTVLYTRLTAAYTATGGEQYMTVGNFDYVAQTQYMYISPASIASNHTDPDVNYPLIDDISLVSDTTLPMISLSEFYLGNDTVLCPGSTLTIGGQPYFFHYTWNTGDTTQFITISQPGTYWCTADYGCNTVTDTINTLPPANITAFSLPDTVTCLAGGYTVYAPVHTGYEQYLWSTGDTAGHITIHNAGTYWLQINNGCGATYTDTFTVADGNTPIPPFSLPDVTLCGNKADTVYAPVGYLHYLWSTGDTTGFVVVSIAGHYSVQVANGCGSVFDTSFNVLPQVYNINLGNDTTICNGSFSYTLSVPQGLTGILWSTGDTTTTLTVALPGTYYVQAQSACGMLRDTVTISFCRPVIDSISIVADTICSGQCLLFSAGVHNYAQSYWWAFSGGTPGNYSGAQPGAVCYDTTGSFDVTLVVASPGGSDTLTRQVVVMPKPVAGFADTTITVNYNTTLLLPPCTNAMHTQWYYNGTLVCDGCTTLNLQAKEYSSNYKCVVSNAGCSDTCNYVINVTDIPTQVWLPTAFSPNGDGRNDYFHLITDNPNIEVVYFAVYNRYGQRVYFVQQNDKGWDGTHNGIKVDMGTYYWLLRYKVAGNNTLFTKKGDVTVYQ